MREFKRCDADGSGRVSVSEVRGAAATLGHDVSDEEAKELVSAVDADADGTISFEEFCKVGCGSSARQVTVRLRSCVHSRSIVAVSTARGSDAGASTQSWHRW